MARPKCKRCCSASYDALREDGARRREAKIFDEVLSQESHRNGVEQERALAGEADDASFGIELQKLVVIEIVG